jgi:CheY-like chemotaxis protein
LVTAKNGEDALVKLAELKEDPSVVFVDLNMPIMNGAEFLLRLKERGLATSSRIVIFTASEKQKISKLDNSLTWLSKPFNLVDVLKTINQARLH